MKIQKSSLTVDGNSIHMAMPFAKVDEEKRLVSGYATLDNIDSQGDVVLAEASVAAFSRARGNLREMHDKIAVGKVVDFKENEFFDAETGQLYRGIYVTAYVSKGAQDTWEKVLDGTLSGFSIGGEVNDASSEFVKEAGKTVRFIKDYDLVELSLVDNPANQLANVFSFQKSASGNLMVKGMAVDTNVETVFICTEDETVIVRDSESEVCPVCERNMESAGWFESASNRAEKVGELVNKFLNPSAKEDAPISEGEGGVEMAKGENEVVTETPEVEENSTEEEVTVDENAEEQTEDEAVETVDETEGTEEESETPEEVVDEETEISKKIDELHEAVKESLEKSAQDTAAKVTELEKKIEDATASFLTKASELESKFDEFGTKIEATKARILELEGSLEKMNSADAFRKSADVAEPRAAVETKETTWNGAFSGKRSRFSVDDL